jgi:hypothetical protein
LITKNRLNFLQCTLPELISLFFFCSSEHFTKFKATISLMDLLHTEQVSFDQVYLNDIDLVIGVSGYEKRSPYLMERIKLGNEKKLVLAFEERMDEMNRPENDRIFGDLGFEFVYISGNSGLDIEGLLSYIPARNKDVLRILIDYSCMTKPWYASFIEYLSHTSLPYRKVHLLFSYTQSAYVEPKKPKPLRVAEPLGYGSHGMMAGKPIALVMGLGYEKDRGDFLRKAVNPVETFCFYADPTIDKRYVEKVYINNFKLIDSLHKRNVFPYPAEDLNRTSRMLTDLCIDLRLKYRIILAPLGPKPFALLSILIGARYPDIEIWRVSAGKLESVYDRIPVGEPMVYSVEFGRDDEY